MAVVEVVLGALVALAGGGAGWIGRGKYDAAQRANEAATKKVPSERRKAGGAKAAATRKAKAEQKALEQQGKVIEGGGGVSVNGRAVDMGLVQRQQFQGMPNGAGYARDEVGREQA
jgi:hypothetical protein